MGTADAGLAARLGHHVLVGDGNAEVDQALGQTSVACAPVGAQPVELLAEGSVSVVDEIDENVEAAGAEGHAGHLATGHERKTEFVSPPCRGRQALERVVVGQGHGRAADLGRQLDDTSGRVRPVRHEGVGVQIDHRRRRYCDVVTAPHGPRARPGQPGRQCREPSQEAGLRPPR